MAASRWLCRRTSWRRAFALSAALHALALVGLALVPGPKAVHPTEQRFPNTFVCPVGAAEAESGSAFLFPHALPGSAMPGPSGGQPQSTPLPFQPQLIDAGNGQVPPEPSTKGSADGSAGGKNPGPPGNGQGVGSSGIPGGNGGTFFNVAVRGQRVVYVIDRSSSMGKRGALDIARRELLASLQALPADASFQVIVYNSTAQPLMAGLPGWLRATPENRQLAAQALARLDATGGTVHHLALPMALALRPNMIFFLTDADDLSPWYLDEITRQNQSHCRAAIHVIELNIGNRGRPDMPLQAFARQNQGRYQAVDLDHVQ